MMATTRDKWVRRFIIPETTRHKKGFTIYKVTSVVFLKSSHVEVSKVSVWKRYNDFKKLHSELSALCSRSQIKESFPSFPKPKFFGRFETEIIEERRESALKFLEFIGRHLYLYSSDIFIKFFETSHEDCSLNDCSQSLSSDTSAEDDHRTYINTLPTDDIVSQSIFQPRSIQSSLRNSCSVLAIPIPKDETKQPQEASKSKELQSTQLNDTDYKTENEKISMTKNTANNLFTKDSGFDKIVSKLENNELICKNNNHYKDTNHNVKNGRDSILVQTSNSNTKINETAEDLDFLVTTHDGSDLPQPSPDSSQYILVAAAHMSAAFKHEDLIEYEEAFTQYKMGISSLQSGVECDSNKMRAEIIKEKISKYLKHAERLYNRYLNCNISVLSKPISELQYYKVLKIIKSVMLTKDIRKNCLNIVKAIGKPSTNKGNINNKILRGQVPYMVQLHAFVETETTTFLILQYLSRGLWDFITSHYNSNSNDTCDKIIVENSTEKSNSDNNIILEQNGSKNEIEDTMPSMENLNLNSINSKIQTEIDPVTVEEKYENYRDVSTTQLLEKAQILLQSVNATLKESNSVASRLRECNCLINHDDNTTLLNLKNCRCQSKDWNGTSVAVNEIPLEIDGIHKNTVIEDIPEKNVIISDYLPLNNINKISSQCSTDNSSLSDSCKDLSSDEKESTSSTDNLKPFDKHLAIEHQNSNKTANITSSCELNRLVASHNKSEKNNYYSSNDQQIQYTHNTQLIESTKNNNSDIERELWTIPENVIRLWAAEILLALEALHQQEVIVFDLKPDNILLDDHGHVRLTYVVPIHNIYLVKYKYPYASPELCMYSRVDPVTPATDIWSFGVILYELIVGNKFLMKHPCVFKSHSIINIPNKLSQNAKSLLLNILKYEPHERMTIPEIKQHPFFKDINWSSLVNSL